MVQVGNSWDELLKDEWQKDYYQKLRKILAHEYRTQTIYPDMYDIFNALKFTPYESCKVVILGQDPYHGPGQAHGLSFSVRPGIKPPPSLENIFKELQTDMGIPAAQGGTLTCWAQQGVLLLNTVLTVRAGQANSHAGLGWQTLTDRIIQLLNNRAKPMVFLLWGANAAQKQPLISNPQHLILKAPHPSPLSAHRGFFGCRHFSQTNRFLQNSGQTPIDWRVGEAV